MKNAMQLKAIIEDCVEIIDVVKNSEIMQKQWKNYQKDFEYATDIEFFDTCDTILSIMSALKEE